MEEEIKQFKQENGNVVYSIKDLLGALHIKIDKVNERLADGDITFTDIQNNLLWHKRALIGIYSALTGLLILFLTHMGVF